MLPSTTAIRRIAILTVMLVILSAVAVWSRCHRPPGGWGSEVSDGNSERHRQGLRRPR